MRQYLHTVKSTPAFSSSHVVFWYHGTWPLYFTRNTRQLFIRTTAQSQQSSSSVREFKTPQESTVEIKLPLEDDRESWVEFESAFGTPRYGKILETLDGLAGTVAFKHCEGISYDPTPVGGKIPFLTQETTKEHNLTIVTASMDRAKILAPFNKRTNFRIRGFIQSVGRSSMDVCTEVYDCSTKEEDVLAMVAHFNMVARDTNSNTSVEIPGLTFTNAAQELTHEQSQKYKEKLMKDRHLDLDTHPPSPEESALLHSILSNKQDTPFWAPAKTQLPMKAIETNLWTHPVHRNLHGKIYGGYLVRQAFELAFISAATFSGERPELVSIHDINFLHPVEVGSLLSLSSTVVYTSESKSNPREGVHPWIQVQVHANLRKDMRSHEISLTNVFNFSFRVENNTRGVKPHSYTEAMAFLSGRRRILELKDMPL